MEPAPSRLRWQQQNNGNMSTKEDSRPCTRGVLRGQNRQAGWLPTLQGAQKIAVAPKRMSECPAS